jgi:hypothetical protein
VSSQTSRLLLALKSLHGAAFIDEPDTQHSGFACMLGCHDTSLRRFRSSLRGHAIAILSFSFAALL